MTDVSGINTIHSQNGFLKTQNVLNPVSELGLLPTNLRFSGSFFTNELTMLRDMDYLPVVLISMFDNVAERILQLGGNPLTTAKAYLNTSKLAEEESDSFTPEYVLKVVLADLETLHKTTLALVELCDEANDISTGNMIGGD
jgi:hypothetical protein